MCLTQVKYYAATVKRKHIGQQKMMEDKQNLKKNTGKGMQEKHLKNVSNSQTQTKNNKCMKKYKIYQYIVEATQMPNSIIN